MILELPEVMRPRGVYYTKCALGVSLPAGFVKDVRAFDNDIYPVFHRYRLLWDNIMNEYNGPADDPRMTIESKHGELNFGFVLTDGHGVPIPEGCWHLWRLCHGYGWAHIIKLETKDHIYLNLVLKNMYLQDKFNRKYGARGWSRYLESVDLEKRQKLMDEEADLMNEIAKANSGMVRRVMDNFGRGVNKPTNPQKETIMSGAGISNRSRIVRPASDREGGLILPPGYGEE